METGEKYIIRVTDVSTSGEGIGRAEGSGMVVFVPGLIPGDEAEVEITGRKKNTARGKVLRTLHVSPERAEPPCPAFGRCGGCSLQNMEYGAQLRLKTKQLTDKLRRICGGDLPAPEEPAGMDVPWHYRNKAEYAVGWGRRSDGTKGPVVGFYDRGSRRVVEAEYCLIQSPAAELAAAGLRQYIEESGVSIYNERTGRGLLRRMTVRTGWESGEVMIVITINGKELSEAQLLADIMSEALDTEEYELRSIAFEYNTNRDIAAPGAKTEVVAGGDVIRDTLAGMHFEISPQSFYQVNPAQTAVLYDTVLEFADAGPEDVVFDLYCGVGTIGIFCAPRAKYVWGIESVKSAVIDANRNAVINGLVNIQFIRGRAEEKILQLEEKQIRPDVVILDPPRAGCRPELIESVERAAPSRIVYVSCEPATMARDLKALTASGEYRISRVKLIDQFCHTIRSESVCLLERANGRKTDAKVHIDADSEDYYRTKDSKELEVKNNQL